MKIILQTLVFLACNCFFLLAAAEPVRQISWSDLIPADLRNDEYLENLTEKQMEMVLLVINTIEALPNPGKDTEEYWQEVDKALPILREHDIDIAKVMEKRKKLQTAVVKDLNGKLVRLPGFILPLEMSGDKVTEFLLVPYVGACIHAPPPPPNQIIFVKTDAKEGYDNKQLYDPVWVTGVISVQPIVKDLYLVDGSAGIDIGYSMQAGHIEQYE